MTDSFVAIDFETYLISEDMPVPKPVCLSYADGNDSGLWVGHKEMEDNLVKLFKSGKTLIAHNASFELNVIDIHFPEARELMWQHCKQGKVICTQIAQEIINCAVPYKFKVTPGKGSGMISLARLVERYLKKDISNLKGEDAWRMRYNELDGVELEDWPQEAIDYAIGDSIYAYEIYMDHQKWRIEKEKLTTVEENTMHSFTLNRTGANGALVDKERLAIAEQEVIAHMRPHVEYLKEQGYILEYDEENFTYKKSNVKLKQYIFDNVAEPEYGHETAGERFKRFKKFVIDELKRGIEVEHEDLCRETDPEMFLQSVVEHNEEYITLRKAKNFGRSYDRQWVKDRIEEDAYGKKHVLRVYKKVPKYDYLEAIDKTIDFIKQTKAEEQLSGVKKMVDLTKKVKAIADKCPTAPSELGLNKIKCGGDELKVYLGHHPELEILERFIKVFEYEKALTSYIRKLKTVKEVVRTNYSVAKNTGRTSSFGTRLYPSVNFQQFPRKVPGLTYDIRNLIIPRPGYKICAIDYNGLEPCSTGHALYQFFGHSKLAEAFNEGNAPIDIHSRVSIESMKVSGIDCTYEEFVSRKKEPEYEGIRTVNKGFGNGKIGGMGRDLIRDQLAQLGYHPKMKIMGSYPTEAKAKKAVRYLHKKGINYVRHRRAGFKQWDVVYDEILKLETAFFNLTPELKDFMRSGVKKFYCMEPVPGSKTGEMRVAVTREKNKWGEDEFNELYNLEFNGVKRYGCTYTQLCNNFLMQTPSAVGAKRMFSNLAYEYRNDTSVVPLAFIHDEVVFEVRDDENMYKNVERVAEIMIDSMQEVLYSVRIAVEADLMDYWMKSGGFFCKTYWKDPDSDELKSGD